MLSEVKQDKGMLQILENYFEKVELSVFGWDAASVLVNVLLLGLNAVLLGSVIVAAMNLRASRRAQVSQVFQWAVQQMEEIKADEKILMAANRNFAKWTDEQIQSAVRVCNRYQRLAFMAEHKLIERKYFMEMWGLNYALVWSRVGDFIVETRKRNNEPERIEDGAFSRRHFEVFAKKASFRFQDILYR